MEASWPATSGATRISVVRTTPTIGVAGSGRHSTYRPAPAATRSRASTIMRARPRLAMRPPPVDEKRRHHRQDEIGEGEEPKSAPVMRHLVEGRAKLVHAHEAVDREIGRKQV